MLTPEELRDRSYTIAGNSDNSTHPRFPGLPTPEPLDFSDLPALEPAPRGVNPRGGLSLPRGVKWARPSRYRVNRGRGRLR